MSVDIDTRGRILTVTMNRPEALNAMNAESRRRLVEAFTEFRENDDLWVAILTGAGDKAFCAGMDIKEAIIPVLDRSVWEKRRTFLQGRDIFHALENQTKPVIAAINGYAMGGGLELALCCDIRIASENAVMALPEVNIGIMPGCGGTQRLSRIVGLGHALDMTLTGDRVTAPEAYRIGLVSRVVPPGDLMNAARGKAEAICRKAPLAVRFAKEAVRRGAEMSLTEGLTLESALFTLLRGTRDAREGTAAFAEKRQPDFRGE